MGCSQGNRELLQATGAGEGRRSGVVPLPSGVVPLPSGVVPLPSGVVPLPSGVVRQWPAQPLRQRT